MARPSNDALKEKLRIRYAELCKEHPLGSANLKIMIANEFGVTPRTVWYYLQGKTDARKKYTPQERSYLSTATYGEVVEWAKLHGKNPASVYSVARRLRTEVSNPDNNRTRRQMVLQEQNCMDFGSRDDLHAMGYSPAEFKAAKDVILRTYKLSLVGPNFIYQREKNRHIALTLSEQCGILREPVAFLRRFAKMPNVQDRWEGVSDGVFIILADRMVAGVAQTHKDAAQHLRGVRRYTPFHNASIISAPKGDYAVGTTYGASPI